MGSLIAFDKIARVLKSIGLNKNEIKIFLDLNKHDSSSALDLSRRTEIHRSNVYDSLRVLMEKGFVAERTEGTKKLFQALDPSRIKEYVIQKEREIDSIMPELRQISASKSDKGNVSISQGVLALRSVFMGLLDLGESISICGVPKGMRERLGEGFLDDFHNKRIELGIKIRNIYDKDAFNERVIALGRRDYTEVKCVEGLTSLGVVTIICGEKVVVVVFNEAISIVEIAVEGVSEAYRGYFDLLWAYSNVC